MREEPEFKVGDWVEIIESYSPGENECLNKIYQIKGMRKDKEYYLMGKFNLLSREERYWDLKQLKKVPEPTTGEARYIKEVSKINEKLIIFNQTNQFQQEYSCEFKEEKEMELKDIKKENIKEARKQYTEEKANEEIRQAKIQLRGATDEIDRLDRDKKTFLEADKEMRKPLLAILNKFK